MFGIFETLQDLKRARASPGLVTSCMPSADTWKYLGILSKGAEPGSWVVAAVKKDVSPKTEAGRIGPETVALHVTYTAYTVDPIKENTRLADWINESLFYVPFLANTHASFC